MMWHRSEEGQFRWRARTEGRKLRNVALGGFTSEILSSEIILGYDGIPKDNPFVLGYMFFNIVNPIGYTLGISGSPTGNGDLKTAEKNGLNGDYVKTILVSHALLSAYRLYYKKHGFLPFIKTTDEEIVAGLSWRW